MKRLFAKRRNKQSPAIQAKPSTEFGLATYNSITTKDFRTYGDTYQQDFANALICKRPDIVQFMLDNRIRFSKEQTDMTSLDIKSICDDTILYALFGSVALSFTQEPSANPQVFPLFLQYVATLVLQKWRRDVVNLWKYQPNMNRESVDHLAKIMSTHVHIERVMCYDGFVGCVHAISVADTQTKTQEGDGIFLQNDVTLEFDVPMTLTEGEALTVFKLVAYTHNGKCTFSPVAHYDSPIHAPQYPTPCESSESIEVYVGNRTDGVSIKF